MTGSTVRYIVTSTAYADEFEQSTTWQHMVQNVDFITFPDDDTCVHAFDVYSEYVAAFEALLDLDSTVFSYTSME